MKIYTEYMIKTDKLWELETLSYLKMRNMVFRERILINSVLHLTFSMVPNIVFAPNTMQNGWPTLYLHLTLRRMQNTDRGHKTQTQLITGFISFWSNSIIQINFTGKNIRKSRMVLFVERYFLRKILYGFSMVKNSLSNIFPQFCCDLFILNLQRQVVLWCLH